MRTARITQLTIAGGGRINACWVTKFLVLYTNQTHYTHVVRDVSGQNFRVS